MGTEEEEERRSTDLERREAELAAKEAALAERGEAAEAILSHAAERDAISDARDVAAEKRECDLDLAELLAAGDDHGYGDNWPERRNAGLDRQHAKGDRAASKDDRIALTDDSSADATDEA